VEDALPPGPAGAGAWLFGPDSPIGETGLRTKVSEIWGGVGFYADRAAAEAVLADPVAHLPWLDGTAEHWHALAGVIAHRGEVDWSRPGEAHPALVPLGADPGGVMAVITSAGYVTRDAARLPQIVDFQRRVDAVRAYYGTLEANVALCLFNAVDTPEGMTFTIWKSDRAMMSSAYRSGTHSENLARHQERPMFDRSSFTRLRLLASCGSWDGADPRVRAQAS
jgi:hypothetical protein